jgi:hypothetical protein
MSADEQMVDYAQSRTDELERDEASRVRVVRSAFIVFASALAVVALCAVSAKGAVGAARPSAAIFVEHFLDAQFRGDVRTEWKLLHPGQRAALNRARFMKCSASPDYSKSRRWSWQVLGKRSDVVLLINVPQHTSTEVALRATFTAGSSTSTQIYVKHAVWVGSRWAWILSPAEYDAFTHGYCPS